MEFRWFYVGVCVLGLSILAALRAPGVGVDTYAYAIPTFERARRFQSLSEAIGGVSLEVGYVVVAYICSRLVDDVHMLYFATELIICVPVFYFVTHWPREKTETMMLAAAWLLIYYNLGYNAMRQWMAMGFGLCACMELLEGRKLRFWLLSAVATLFHTSAVILAGFYFLILFLRRGGISPVRSLFLVIAALVALLGLDGIVSRLISMGILKTRYTHYVVSVMESSSTLMQLAARAPVVIGCTVLYRELCQRDERNKIVYAFLLLDAAIAGMVNIWGFAMQRLSMYFGMWQCVAITQLHEVIRHKVGIKYRWVVTLIFFAILLLYWWYYFDYRGFGGSVPYRTDVF